MFVVICALFGVIVEIVFTAYGKFKETYDWNVKGEVSPWMFLVYGSIGLVFPYILNIVGGWPIPLRAFVHGGWIMAGEILWGLILDKGLNVRPWHYKTPDALFNGYTRAAYYPLWCIFGLCIEVLYTEFGKF